MKTKTLSFSEDVLKVLRSMQWALDGSQGVIDSVLPRELYTQVNKALVAMGGKWNRGKQAHLFTSDPRPQVEGLLSTGTMEVEALDFFETPEKLAARMVKIAKVKKGMRVLEPNAGHGRIAIEIRRKQAILSCVEISAERSAVLESMGFDVWKGDFLLFNSDPGFQAVVMNPPFSNLQDIDHVLHAFTMLAVGGILVAVMSEGSFHGERRKVKEFLAWIEANGGNSEQLDPQTFKESGTNVNTRLLTIIRRK